MGAPRAVPAVSSDRALACVVLASGNAGKLRELRALLAPTGIALVAQAALGVPDADEPHATFVENALAKARHASAATGLPAIADDSGVCVAALGGAPGVRSARFAADAGARPGPGGADAANNARLVRALAGVADRTASYHCVLVLVRAADDPRPVIAEADWYGEIVDAPRGAGGFGYDPHFLLPELGRTVAELDPDVKNRDSHRGRAMHALLEALSRARLLPASPHADG